MGSYATLLFLVNSQLNNLITKVYLSAPQTFLLNKKNKYLYNYVDKKVRLNTIIKLIDYKYNNNDLFNLINKLNNYKGKCKIKIFIHKTNKTDNMFINDINNNLIEIIKLNEKTNNNHNMLKLILKDILNKLIFLQI